MPNPPYEYQIIQTHISKFIEKKFIERKEGDATPPEPFHVRVPIKKIQDINVYTELVITNDRKTKKINVAFLIYTLYVYQLKPSVEARHKIHDTVTEDDKDYYLLYTFQRTLELSHLSNDETLKEISPETNMVFTSFSQDFVTELFEELKSLRFSKCYNVFVKSDDYLDDYYNSINDALVEVMGDKYECAFQSCCICYEMTNHNTFCGHHVCIPCLDTLDDFRCPMCRVCLHCNMSNCDKIEE